MKVNFHDIPPGKTFKDYPPDTIFVFSEPQLKQHHQIDKTDDNSSEDSEDSKEQFYIDILTIDKRQHSPGCCFSMPEKGEQKS